MTSLFTPFFHIQKMFSKRSEPQRRYSPLIGSVIVLDGQIATGKTTAGRSLERYLNEHSLQAKFYQEYVNHDLLTLYISDMDKYAFSFQLVMLCKRLEIYKEASEFAKQGGIAIVDRSLSGDLIFSRMQINKGRFTAEEERVYYQMLSEGQVIEPSATVYLRCEPEVAFSRIKKRGHFSEVSGYTLEYLQEIHSEYEKLMREMSHPVIQLNWNTDHEVYQSTLSEAGVRQILDALIDNRT